MRSAKQMNCKVLLWEYHSNQAHNQEVIVSAFQILHLCQDILHPETLVVLSRLFGQPENTNGMQIEWIQGSFLLVFKGWVRNTTFVRVALPFWKMSLWPRGNSKQPEVRIIANYKLVLKNMRDLYKEINHWQGL